MTYLIWFVSIMFLLGLFAWLIILSIRSEEQSREIEKLKNQLSFFTKQDKGNADITNVYSTNVESANVYSTNVESANVNRNEVKTSPSFQHITPPQVIQKTVPVEIMSKTKDEPRTFESLLGRNVIGIVASILVFIGLIFLGTLIYKQITDDVKILAMFTLSAIITAIGVSLTLKKRNNFTIILSGCGCGSFFISILLTHVYFNKIIDIIAFSLLLIWMAITLYMSKKLSSTLLSIVAHTGMIFSICFAFAQGITDQKLLILLIYQAASIAVILIGNILCSRKTYNFGIFISLLLTIISSIFMWGKFSPINIYPFNTALSTYTVIAAFVAQFLCSSFLSYLLSVSTNRLKDVSYKIGVHIINKIIWATALIINIYRVAYLVSIGNTVGDSGINASSYSNAVFMAVMVCFAVILIHVAITLFLSIKLNFDDKLESLSILFLSALSSILLLILWNSEFYKITSFPHITYLIVISLVLLLIRKITNNNNVYSIGVNVILGLDIIYMLSSGYKIINNFGTVALSLGYMLLYVAIIFFQLYKKDESFRVKDNFAASLSSYIIVEASLIAIFSYSQFEYKTEILLIILTILNIVLYIVKFDMNSVKSYIVKYVMRVNSIILVGICSGFIAFVVKDSVQNILYLVLAALVLGLSFVRINEVLDGKDNKALGILTGFELTIIVLATVQGHTSWFDQTYIFSIVCMLTALVCIILGFVGRSKVLRIYGLVLTMFCVLKLVTYDVTALNTPLRVTALIVGGIICFVISAIYNYTSKKVDTKIIP